MLLARVPFSPEIASVVTIALELPDGVVVDIEADVEGVRRAPDGKKSAIRMILRSMEDVRPRLARAVAMGRRDAGHEEPVMRRSMSIPRTKTGLFVPIPSDAPIDELVPAIRVPSAADVPEDVRPRYQELEKALAAMREKAAHDVLGVDWDAEVAEIRVAYFGLVKQYHPDVLSRYGSEEILLLASEIFVYINKAYDRLRDSAVAAGKAIAAGPALLPSSGWIANFDDIGIASPDSSLRTTDFAAPIPVPVKAMSTMAANSPEIGDNVEVNFSATTSGPIPVETESFNRDSELESNSLFADARSTASGMSPLHDRVEDSGRAGQEQTAKLDTLSLIEESRGLLDAKSYDAARETLARVLEREPRNREARALYHVAYGYTLVERDNATAARTQFEVALKHDPKCKAATAALSRRPLNDRKRRPSLLDRIFRR